jgi:hypothetical protein
MRTSTKVLCAAVAAAGLASFASQAHAAAVGSWASVGAPRVGSSITGTGATTSTLSGYTGWVLTVTVNGGTPNMSAVDFGEANGGFISAPSAMLQTWTYNDVDTSGNPSYDTAANPSKWAPLVFSSIGNASSTANNPANADSHFLGLNQTVTTPNAPEANFITPAGAYGSFNSFTSSDTSDPDPNNWLQATGVQYGTTLTMAGAFGIPVAASTVKVAYIVLPNGVTPNNPVGANVADTTGHFTEVTFNPVPEPASIGVLALGGLALLARRRKA